MKLTERQRDEARKHIWRRRRQRIPIPYKKLLEGGKFPKKTYKDLKLLFTMEEREIDDEERRKGAASRKREECEAKEAQLSKIAADAEKKLKEAKLQTERAEEELQEVMSIGFQKARKADELHYAVQTAKQKHEEACVMRHVCVVLRRRFLVLPS